VAGACEYGDKISVSGATDLVNYLPPVKFISFSFFLFETVKYSNNALLISYRESNSETSISCKCHPYFVPTDSSVNSA
jgi:hypothetical protein